MQENNPIIQGYWKHLWAHAWENIEPLQPLTPSESQKIDRKILPNLKIKIAGECNNYGFKSNMPYKMNNLICEIDQIGEWTYDPIREKIFFAKPQNDSSIVYELSTCQNPLVKLENLDNFTLSGIQLRNEADNGITINQCKNIKIENSIIHGFPKDGIIIDQSLLVELNQIEIFNMGRGGIDS